MTDLNDLTDPTSGVTITGARGINNKGQIVGTGTGGALLLTHLPPVLNVTHSSNGSGTVTGTGINCGSDCSETFEYGDEVILTAQASPHLSFGGWTGCPVANGTECTMLMTNHRNIAATFNSRPAYSDRNKNGKTGLGPSQHRDYLARRLHGDILL